MYWICLTEPKVQILPIQYPQNVYFRSPMSSSSKKPVKPATRSETKSASGKKIGSLSFWARNRFTIFLFCFTFVVFGNSIFNGYALDDEFYTAGSNKLTQKGLKGIPEIFTTRTFFNNDGSGYSYRPVALTTFAIEIQFFGEKARTSHFFNVLIYAFTLVLLFGLLRKWFVKQGDWFSFFICLVFLVHPLHTEVVDNIKCRDELLVFFFGVLMFRFIWRHLETKAWWTIPAMALSFGLAMLSKTTVVPLLVLVPLAVWYFTDKKWWAGLIYVGPIILLIVIAKFALISRLPEMTRTLQGFENPIVEMNFSQLSATATYVLGRYLWLHIIPYPLIFYYGLKEVPVCSWSDIPVILSLVAYLGIAVFTWFEFRKKSAAGFGLLFFLGNIILFSNFFGAAPGIMAERFTYMASFGFAIVLVDLVFRFAKTIPESFVWKSEASGKAKWTFVAIITLFSLRSIARNEAWEDKETLYRNDVELAPESAKINMLLGSLLSSQAAQMNYEGQQMVQQGMQRDGQAKIQDAIALFNESKAYYQQATEIFPEYYTAWSNLGTAYYFLHDYRNGLPFFHRAIAIKEDYAEAYFNLGMSYEQLGLKNGAIVDTAMIDSSIYYFTLGLQKDPEYVNSADQLSRILMSHKRDSSGAMNLLMNSAKANPESDVPWNAMSNIMLRCGDTLGAATALEKAAAINPNNEIRLRNLAAFFSMHGNAEKANYYNSLYLAKKAEIDKRNKRLGKSK